MLTARAIVPLAVLAMVAVGIYLATAHREVALYVVAGLQGALLIFLFGDIAWNLLRKPPGSPAQRVRVFGRVLAPVAGTLLCLSVIAQQRGWLRDGADSALAWTACAISVGVSVWTVGERRLMAVLAARAAAKQRQPE